MTGRKFLSFLYAALFAAIGLTLIHMGWNVSGAFFLFSTMMESITE